MKLELEQFPLERLYFLESKEFLDKEEKIFLKQNSSFKLNSYYLGMSKRKINNDKMLYLFNGLRGYYEVNSRFVKNPKIMEIKPPMSKIMYKLFFKRRKYKYQDLIIYSLKLFTRPTITLISDENNSGEIYHFPYKLLEYLNEKRTRFLIKKNYNIWKKEKNSDYKYLKLNLFVYKNRFNKKSYRRLQSADATVLGFLSKNFAANLDYFNKKFCEIKMVFNKLLTLTVRNKRKLKRRIPFYKTKGIIQSLLVSRNKLSFRRRKNKPYFVCNKPCIKPISIRNKEKFVFFVEKTDKNQFNKKAISRKGRIVRYKNIINVAKKKTSKKNKNVAKKKRISNRKKLVKLVKKEKEKIYLKTDKLITAK